MPKRKSPTPDKPFIGHFIDPIFGCRYRVILHDKLEVLNEVHQKIVKKPVPANDGVIGFVEDYVDKHGVYHQDVFLLEPILIRTVSHEAKHCVNNVWNRIGMKLDQTNDECECYYLDWIVNSITTQINKRYAKQDKENAEVNRKSKKSVRKKS